MSLLPDDDNPTATGKPADARPAEYEVVARRYRPQTFEDLIGQQHVAQALTGAIKSGRIGHAYLFTGARGVGKTSAARILAKALNCVNGPTATPCNQCDSCQAISSGDDVDVQEMDGASNRGIDEIRELRQNVGIRPSRSRFKVYIIDEVHMLTREAFNALLKTLEEPPEHVKFIFCTTEAEKIPITILSRCQRFDFAGIQTTSIVERLRQIVEAEGVQADQEALDILARRAAGSMRDSQSLLEQLLACGDATITVADVHRLLGTAGDHRLGKLVEHLVERRMGEALAELDAGLGEGVDVGQLLEQLLGYFRDLMVACAGSTDEAFLYVSPSERATVRRNAERLGIDTTLAVMQILDQTLARLRYSTHGRTLAELALIRICKLEDLEELGSLIAEIRTGTAPTLGTASPGAAARPALAAPAAAAAPAISAPARPAPEPAKKKADEPIVAPTANDSDSEPIEEPSTTVAPPADATPITAQNASQIWQQVLHRLSDMTSANASMGESVALLAPQRLAVRFRPKYTSCKLFCERAEQTARLQEGLFAVTGQRVQLEFELLADAPGEKVATADSRPRQASSRERLHEKREHPMVRRAIELFDARPVKLLEENET